MKIGFDNAKYITLQAEHIKERIGQFGGKLYLEFGGKLFDDYHASRVLPGFEPDSKIRMLKSLSEDVEVVIAINANHIESDKVRGDLGITYDEDVLRLMDVFAGMGIYVGSVVITHYAGQPKAGGHARAHPPARQQKGDDLLQHQIWHRSAAQPDARARPQRRVPQRGYEPKGAQQHYGAVQGRRDQLPCSHRRGGAGHRCG